MKRILTVILLLAVTLSSTSCIGMLFDKNDPGSDSLLHGGEGSENSSESGSEEESESLRTEDLDGYVPLTENGKPLYVLVFQSLNIVSDGMSGAAAAGDYMKAANSLAAELKEMAGGVEFSVVTDRKLSEQTLKIIAFGRVEGVNDSVYDTLRYQDYAVSQNELNVGIAGYNEGSLNYAVKDFKKALKVVDGDIYVKLSAIDKKYEAIYRIGEMTVGQRPIDEYVIRYESGQKEKAILLKTKICDLSGVVLPITTEETQSPAIVINKTGDDSSYGIKMDGDDVIITYGTDVTWNILWNHITNKLGQVEYRGSVDLDSLCKDGAEITEAQRKIMSFNVLNVWNETGAPGTRDDKTAEMILGYMPDFVGLQEFDVPYRNATGGLISKLSEKYAEVEIEGVAKDTVWNPIFYLKDKYTVVESGFIYFPDYSENSYDSSYYAESCGKMSKFRSLVWAVLRDADGNTFVVGNLHFSPQTLVENVELTHSEEAKLVADTLKAVAARYEGSITLVTGDYNSWLTGTGGAKELLSHGFKDTYDLSTTKTNLSTSHDQGSAPTGTYREKAIDHVMTLNVGLQVDLHLVITDQSVLDLSDHCPVIVQFTVS